MLTHLENIINGLCLLFDMKVPISGRKRALLIVDVQSAFIDKRNHYILQNIKNLIHKVHYDLYIEVIFHAEKGSIWDKQTKWTCPKDKGFNTVNVILESLKNKKVYHIEKNTKSAFKGNKNIFKILKNNTIAEVHIVGTETNDCILATAYEAFDLGFFTYVIEECCQSASLTELHKKAIDLLRRQMITNNSSVEKIDFKEI